MSASLAPARPPAKELTDSSFTGTTVPHELLETIERDQQVAIRKKISTVRAAAAQPRLSLVSSDISEEAPRTEQIFDTIQALYLSSNRPRDRQIAERLTALYRDALAEDEEILSESLSQFKDFFLKHRDLGLPKITLTPDGTLHAHWIQGPGNFLSIEFVGGQVAKLVAQIPRNGLTARHFSREAIHNVVSIARAIGASLG